MNTSRSFILCATDFSSGAVDAATVAAKLALRRGAALQLVHATSVPRASALMVLNDRLGEEAARLRQLGVQVEPRLLDGPRADEEMTRYIERERPGLVVVGCDLKSPLDRWALGSFSEKIAETSPAPTLVVRNPAAFESWDWVKERLRVLLALDFYSSSDVVLRWARQFQRDGPCDFVACHVHWRTPTLKETAATCSPVILSEDQLRLERDLRKKVRDQIGDDSINTIVRPYFGDPGPCIADIATEAKAHLIAIGAHQRRGLHRVAQFSVSREVLHQSMLNVICIPITTAFDPHEAHIPDFRRVLVTTDFSECGNTAVPFACAAGCIRGIVKLVYVAPPRLLEQRRPGASWPADLTEQLRALIPRETAPRYQLVETAVLENDDVAKAICAEAERFGADLVCMASHGQGASSALHGSVTKAVLKRLRRPLLVIRRPEE